MPQFVKAVSQDDHTEAFINLDLVSWIKEMDTEYLLNLMGNTYIVKKPHEPIAISLT